MPEMVLVWKRVVILQDAQAKLAHLARTWAVVIRGRIGHNAYKVCEVYDILQYAKDREFDINQEGQAVVASIEEILFPSGYPVLKYIPMTVAISARIPGISIEVKPLPPELADMNPNLAGTRTNTNR